MNKNIALKRIIRTIAFLLVLALLLGAVTMVFLPKWTYERESGQFSGFYEEPENTIDVLGLGSCNMYSSFSPVIMYEKFGITGYNMCCPDQEEHTSYHYILEALKTQKPKVVMIESLFFTQGNGSKREYYNRFALDYMPLSLNKIKLAWQIAKTEAPLMKEYDPSAPDTLLTFFGYIFPILRYHGRTDIEDTDISFFLENDLYNPYKGGWPEYEYTTNDGNVYTKLFNEPEINDITEDYFPKIVELCRENDIQLVVIKSPNYARWGYDDAETSIVRDFVESYDIPFVDFHSEELNTFEEYDYGYSTGRLNVYGMTKLSTELGQWLVDNCGLTPTVLDDDDRARWDDCVEYYYNTAEEHGMCVTPGKLAQLKCTETGLSVRWNAAEGAATYSVYRCEGKDGEYALLTDSAEGVIYYDDGLIPGQGYSYYVVPNEGELAGVASQTMYYIFVDPVKSFSVYNDDGIIRFSYELPEAAQKITIQRHTDTEFNYRFWDSCESENYYNIKTEQGERYFYRLTGVIVDGDRTYRSKAVFADAVSQKKPAIVSCTAVDGTAVIKWSAIKSADSIRIWYSDSCDGEYELIASLDGDETSFTDITAAKGRESFYRISYISKNQSYEAESEMSNTVGIFVPAS